VVSARAHFEQAIALYNPQQYRSALTRYGWDRGAVMLSSLLAQVLWLLGYPNQARKRNSEAQILAQEIGLPRAVTVWIMNTEFYQFLHEVQAVQQQAEALNALCNEHGFLASLPPGMVQRGWALAEQGQEEEGIQQIQQGMSAHRATGTELYRPYHLALLAQAYGKTGQIEKGLTALAEALAAVERTGERWYEAELYRLKGELTLAQSRVQSLGSSVTNL
jgi:predicted ATPase